MFDFIRRLRREKLTIYKQSKSNRSNSLWVIIPTWIIACAAIVTSITTTYFMNKQSDEMKRATDLAWRPYCNIITADTLTFNLTYQYTDPISLKPTKSSIKNWPIDTMQVNDTSKVRALIEISFVPRFDNFGKLPLWLNSLYFSTARYSEWSIEMKKNPSKLIESFREQDVFLLNETDNVVLPDSNFTSKVTGSIGRTISFKELISLASIDSSLFLYPYTYIEYQDFKGRTFDAIRVYFLKIKIDTVGGRFSYHILDFGKEKYAWDIHFK